MLLLRRLRLEPPLLPLLLLCWLVSAAGWVRAQSMVCCCSSSASAAVAVAGVLPAPVVMGMTPGQRQMLHRWGWLQQARWQEGEGVGQAKAAEW